MSKAIQLELRQTPSRCVLLGVEFPDYDIEDRNGAWEVLLAKLGQLSDEGYNVVGTAMAYNPNDEYLVYSWTLIKK